MNLLEKILEYKRAEIAENRERVSLEYLKSFAAIRRDRPDWREALSQAPMGLIAEIKRKSPSAGDIRTDINPANLASLYEEGGAQAISILMDLHFFGGQESDLVTAREQVSLPILYKEFVLSDWQVWHASSLGASAVLLIAAALSDKELAELIACAETAEITPLVEVHTQEEMERVRAVKPPCIGINNRDLTTFEVSLDTTFHLMELVPDDAMVISESGIRSAEDVVKLQQAGVHAVLVGEHLLKQENVTAAVKELMSGVWASS